MSQPLPSGRLIEIIALVKIDPFAVQSLAFRRLGEPAVRSASKLPQAISLILHEVHGCVGQGCGQGDGHEHHLGRHVLAHCSTCSCW